MPAPLLHVESSADLPREADAVVIGGDVVGVFTAYYLARRGVRVALLEKGRFAAEQSSRNWGWCRQQNRDARELPMATKSLQLWENVAKETGEVTGFRRCGLLYLSQDESQLAGWAKWRDFARTAGITTHMLGAEEASARGQGDRAPVEGWCVLADRRNRRSIKTGDKQCANPESLLHYPVNI